MSGVVCALGALLVAAPAALAQGQSPAVPAPRRPLTIEDYYRVQTVGSPMLSPDGKWVAFALSRRIEATNGDSSTVWLVPADGKAPARQISPMGVNATGPRWLDNGRLRFSAGEGVWDYDLTSIAGLKVSRVEGSDRPPTPAGLRSPDGSVTAHIRRVAPPAKQPVQLTDFEKRHEERFKGRQFDWLRFQRDGATFPIPNSADPVVNPPEEIFLVPAAGSGERQLTRLGLRPSGAQWRPDGSALLFTADSTYRNERSYEHNQIWTVGLDGTVRRLSPDPDYDYSDASYSPDGRSILYTRQISTDAVIARRMNHGGPTDLAVMPADGGPERILTADWDYLPVGARWSHDGRYVYFTGGIGGTNHLFRVPAGGGPVEQITKSERRLAGFSFDRGVKQVTFTVGRMESPVEIAVADIDGSNERRLTHVHDGFTREVALGTPERLNFRSKDGTGIEGWLYRPAGFRQDRSYPLVVFSHGGPHSATGYGFDFKLQYFAANGYFVLATNFRGSTGYGEKFLWGSWGGWGNRDGEDVMAGVDHVIARYPIDSARVGTVGHSYGGFMSNWLITQYPDRFAAAAVGAGIVNWVSDYGTADIARTKETEFFGTPWDKEARDLMIRQSPLTYANRAKAATLFINGEIDERVPYSEAEQMFVALKKNGVPAKMIQYADQPHGITGSWNIVHRMLNELRWLNTWLAPQVRRPQP